jgi:hypothetical protein
VLSFHYFETSLAWSCLFCWERKECQNLQWCEFIPAWCTCSGYAFSSVETTQWTNCCSKLKTILLLVNFVAGGSSVMLYSLAFFLFMGLARSRSWDLLDCF